MKSPKFSHKTPHLKGKQHQLDPNLDLKHLVHHSTVQYVDRDADGDVDIYDNPKKGIPDENVASAQDAQKMSKRLLAKQKGELKHTKTGVAFEDLRNWFDKDHPEGNWKRYNTKGEAIGPCAREQGEGKPKCLSNEKAAKMSKDEIAAAVKRKRREDPVANRRGKGGKPKMVSNKIEEEKRESRYCMKCKKMETRDECSYGPEIWDKMTIKNFSESKKSQPDHEHSMARSELSTIEKAVKRLKTKMKGEGNIEAWVQSKITKAADYIDSAADYLDSGEHNVQGSMDEQNKKCPEGKYFCNRENKCKPIPKGYHLMPNGIIMKDDDHDIEEAKNPCWKGYKQEGMKKKGNRMVPNCVPVSEASFEISPKHREKQRETKIRKRALSGDEGSQIALKKVKGPNAPLVRPGDTKIRNINAGYEPSIVEKILLEMEAEVLTEKNKPTNPKLWAKWKAKAKAKFDVYPCVPLESQAITKEGLKTYNELKIGENILTYNIDNDALEWKPILHLHFYEQAPLKRIYKKTGFSVRATENHKWVVKTGDDYQNISLVETKDIHKRMRIVTCSSLNENDNLSLINENWSKKDNWVEKVLSWNKEQREVYLASSIVYDGHDQGGSTKIKERHTFGFTQKNNDHFWATLLSAYLNGYHVSFYEKTDVISGATIIRNKKYHSTQNLIIDDDGIEDVWCPTTENNTWVMVQNGFITITGNSAYANGWAAKGYKSEGGGWKSVSEDVTIEDVNGNTFAEIIDIVKVNEEGYEKCEKCGKIPCECKVKKYYGGSPAKPGPDKNYVKPMGEEIEEAVRIPSKTGNLLFINLTWRGKYYGVKVFFPYTKIPSKKEVQDEIQKIYPGGRVYSFQISDYKPGEMFIQTEDWQKVNRKDRTDGMSDAAVKEYRKQNPKSKLQTAVTEKNPTGKRAERQNSFCRRSKGQKDMHNIDCNKTPNKPICKARRRWNCKGDS